MEIGVPLLFIAIVAVIAILKSIFFDSENKKDKIDIDTIIKDFENYAESLNPACDTDRITACNYYLPAIKNFKKGIIEGCFKSFDDFLRIYIKKKIELTEGDFKLIGNIWCFFAIFRNISGKLNMKDVRNADTFIVQRDNVDFFDFLQTLIEFNLYCKETNKEKHSRACIAVLNILRETIDIGEIYKYMKHPKESWKIIFDENAFVNEDTKEEKTEKKITKKDVSYDEIEKILYKHSNRDIAFNFSKSASENFEQGKLKEFLYDSANLCKFYITSKKELDEMDLNLLKILHKNFAKLEKKLLDDVDIAWACTILLYEIRRVILYCKEVDKQEHLNIVNKIFEESLEKYGENEVLEAINMLIKENAKETEKDDAVFKLFKSACESLQKEQGWYDYFYNLSDLYSFCVISQKELNSYDLDILKMVNDFITKNISNIPNDIDIAEPFIAFLYSLNTFKELSCKNKQTYLDIVNDIFNKAYEKYGKNKILEAIELIKKEYEKEDKG